MKQRLSLGGLDQQPGFWASLRTEITQGEEKSNIAEFGGGGFIFYLFETETFKPDTSHLEQAKYVSLKRL